MSLSPSFVDIHVNGDGWVRNVSPVTKIWIPVAICKTFPRVYFYFSDFLLEGMAGWFYFVLVV